ncbi:MAG: glycosyltransferase family 2 protein [Deltaproteobacteria bacterium]|nr:glycosyltransferase family 2 protein [Deltaproteobacteria bacterium]
MAAEKKRRQKEPSVSIIVPCLNEEGNLRGTIESIKEALASAKAFSDYEILIFNDFSTDGTGKLAEEIKKTEKGVKVIHNPRNMGFGYNYTEGVRLARKDYIIMVPGDNEIPAEAIRQVLSQAGEADVIIPYTANTHVRALSRRVISKLFVIIINTLFGLNVIYYNGTCLIKSSLLKKVPLKTWGFAYMAAILVRLLRSGASYREVGVEIKPRASGKTKAFRFKNIMSVGSAIASLFWEVRIKERSSYNSPRGARG